MAWLAANQDAHPLRPENFSLTVPYRERSGSLTKEFITSRLIYRRDIYFSRVKDLIRVNRNQNYCTIFYCDWPGL